MKIKRLENISDRTTVTVNLSNGKTVNVPPKGILENIEVGDLSGVKQFCRIIYNLNEVK